MKALDKQLGKSPLDRAYDRFVLEEYGDPERRAKPVRPPMLPPDELPPDPAPQQPSIEQRPIDPSQFRDLYEQKFPTKKGSPK